MKQFLLIVMLLGCGLFANAQTTLKASQDTLTNADTSYLVSPRLTSHYGVISIQVNVTKISGTVAGHALVQGSLDGVNYSDVSTDTLTLTNGDNTHLWSLGDSKYTHYRAEVITSGTQESKIKGYIWYR